MSKITTKRTRSKNKGYRYCAKTFYFTYPKCDTSPEEALGKLQEMGINWAVVGQEQHQDGTNHLHMCGNWQKKRNIRDPHFFDSICGQHGNYQSMKNKRGCIEYCTKDGKYVQHGIDVKKFIEKSKPKEKIGDHVVKLIEEGAKRQDIRKAYPGYYLIHRNNVQSLIAEIEQDNQEAPTSFDCPEADESLEGWKLVENWLFENILKAREHKKPQLWLYGPPGAGKSHMLSELRKRLRVYDLSPDKWDDEYDDDNYDIIVGDEYKGQKTLTYLNRISEGTHMPLLRRCRAPYMKKDNKPLIICSNLPIDQTYDKCQQVYRDALHARFLEVRVNEPGLTWTEPELEQSETDSDETEVIQTEKELTRCDAFIDTNSSTSMETIQLNVDSDLLKDFYCYETLSPLSPYTEFSDIEEIDYDWDQLL